MGDEKQWCWRFADEAAVHGPFGSRDDALIDADDYLDAGEERCVVVATVVLVRPVDWVSADALGVLESMEEFLNEEAGFDDRVFSLRDGVKREAEEDLCRHLREWAERWVEADGSWYASDEAEEVVLRATEPAAAARDEARLDAETEHHDGGQE
ncbi:MAG: hypothetical protein WCS88_03920 [Patescibacteria group bacterium]|jgi:hypothetical protein